MSRSFSDAPMLSVSAMCGSELPKHTKQPPWWHRGGAVAAVARQRCGGAAARRRRGGAGGGGEELVRHSPTKSTSYQVDFLKSRRVGDVGLKSELVGILTW